MSIVYDDLKKFFEENKNQEYTLQEIRDSFPNYGDTSIGRQLKCLIYWKIIIHGTDMIKRRLYKYNGEQKKAD